MKENNVDPFHFVDATGLDGADAYRLVIGCVVPRPIAWITTVDGSGRVNVAPFSSYNYVATSPPMLAVQIAKRDEGGGSKDTARNIRESGEFVVNVATEPNLELMHACAEDYLPHESEAEALGIALLESRRVKPPRIAVSPAHMECRLDQIVELGRGLNTLYIGEVVAFHLAPDIYDGKRVDSVKLRPVARLGGPFYSALGEIFHRPMVHKLPGAEGSKRNAKT